MTMRTISTILATLLLVATGVEMQGKTVEIKASALKSTQPLAVQINLVSQKMAWSDTLIINFDQCGTFVIDRDVVTHCHTVMKGVDADKTIVEVQDGKDSHGKSVLKDDNVFGFKGSKAHRISVNIHDLTIKMGDQGGTWWNGDERFLIKCIQAKPVTMHNVKTYLHDQEITNVDMRTCSDVTITDCYFENYNNGPTGGCLWMRGPLNGLTVKNNVFRKHGNDEIIAIFEANLYTGTIVKENINITNNKFYYAKPDKKTATVQNDVLMTLINVQEKNENYVHRNIHFDNNTFELSAPVKSVMAFSYSGKTTSQDVTFSGNTIINRNGAGIDGGEKMDVTVEDKANGNNTVTFSGNKFQGECKSTYSGGSNSHFCLLMRRGNAIFNNNVVTDKYGVTLIYGYEPGGTVTMRNNQCSNLDKLAKVGGGDNIQSFTIIAENNVLSGDTRIACSHLKKCEL